MEWSEVKCSEVERRKGVECARAARFRTAIASNLYEAASCERDSVSYGTQVRNFGESTFISVLRCSVSSLERARHSGPMAETDKLNIADDYDPVQDW